MELNELLIDLFGRLGLEAAQDEYTGNEEKYVTFNYYDEKPILWGDDTPQADTAYLQINLVTPKDFNYFPMKKGIKKALEAAGFCVTSVRSFLGDVYSGTEKSRTTAFEVNYTETRQKEE